MFLLLDLACDAAQHADLAAVVMQEGIAHVCLVTASMTLVRAKIDVNIPRKRKGFCAQHTKVLVSKSIVNICVISLTYISRWSVQEPCCRVIEFCLFITA